MFGESCFLTSSCRKHSAGDCHIRAMQRLDCYETWSDSAYWQIKKVKEMGFWRRLGAFCVVVGVFATPQAAYAVLEIDITEGNIDPLPIAVVDFLGPGSQERQIG